MEFKVNNDKGVMHSVIINHDNTPSTTVIRHRTLGGTPMSIAIDLDPCMTYADAMGRIHKFTQMDDEIFTIVHDAQQED